MPACRRPAGRWTAAGFDPDARVIVKPVWEHGSLGIDPSSVVNGADAARAIAERTLRWHRAFRGSAISTGREFNLALMEERGRARVLPMAETVFQGWDEGDPLIAGYDAKWTSGSQAYIGTPRRFGLETRRARACGATRAGLPCPAGICSASPAMRGSISASMPTARPSILEVNINPCLNPDAGFAAAAAAAGLSYRRYDRPNRRCRAGSLASHRLTCFAWCHAPHPQSGRRHDGGEPLRDRGGAEDHARAVSGDARLRHRQAPRAALPIR